MATQLVCHTQPSISRYGIEELRVWVDIPLAEGIDCLDLNERNVIADETIRQMILMESGARNIAEFQLLAKDKQKDIIRYIFEELGAGPRQMSRVSGLSYTTIYKLCVQK